MSKKSSNFAADFVETYMVRTLESPLVVLDQLPVGRYELSFGLDSEYLANQEESELLGGQVEARAELTLRETDFDLMMHVKGGVQVACDRCLEPVTIVVDASDRMDADDDRMENGKSVDLKWLAYELIVVNLPLTHRHPEGECNPQMQALLQTHLCSASPEDPELQ